MRATTRKRKFTTGSLKIGNACLYPVLARIRSRLEVCYCADNGSANSSLADNSTSGFGRRFSLKKPQPFTRTHTFG